MKDEGQEVLKADDAALIQPQQDEDPDNPLLSIINQALQKASAQLNQSGILEPQVASLKQTPQHRSSILDQVYQEQVSNKELPLQLDEIMILSEANKEPEKVIVNENVQTI